VVGRRFVILGLCVCVCVCVCVGVHACACVCVRARARKSTHVHVCACARMRVHMHNGGRRLEGSEAKVSRQALRCCKGTAVRHACAGTASPDLCMRRPTVSVRRHMHCCLPGGCSGEAAAPASPWCAIAGGGERARPKHLGAMGTARVLRKSKCVVSITL
jgi:hypothetical protein